MTNAELRALFDTVDVRRIGSISMAQFQQAVAGTHVQAAAAAASAASTQLAATLAVGETVTLLHTPLILVGVSIWMERGCQQNDRTLADG